VPRVDLKLSELQRNLLILHARGFNAAEIGRQVDLSEASTNICLAATVDKLNASNLTQAVIACIQFGEFGLDELK